MQIENKKSLISYSIFYTLIFANCYIIIPYFFAYDQYSLYVGLLAEITLISIIFFLLGLNLPFKLKFKTRKIVVNFNTGIYFTFSIFLLLVFVVLITAPRIPIIESFNGANQEELSQYREDFLKGRQGWESSLGYLMGNVNGGIIPYFISLAFLRNDKRKWIFAGIFMLYCISFLEKGYFLKIAIPLFFIYYHFAKNKTMYIIKGVSIIIGFILVMYTFSGFTGFSNTNDERFFSILYLPSNTSENLIWRVVVVPIVTALDSIRVFITQFNSNLFYGDTSSFFAFIKGTERVNFERIVYQGQFGGSETGNANAYYIIEAFVNFGLVGVVLFALFVGRLIRNVIKTKDVALISIMPLFILNLFSVGLIPTMLSGGFLLLFFVTKYIKFT